jgi:hypothetical protein
MEKIKTTIAALLIACLSLVGAPGQAGETYMTATQAQKKFGARPYEPEAFKKGDRKLKGEMAADLILKKAFVGKPLKSVPELLGSPDGYFENKGLPAYIISADPAKGDTWQVVFFPDKDWKTVEEVKIHKNCCD